MNVESPSRHDHPTGASRKKVIEHFDSETRVDGVKSQQQPLEFPLVQPLNIHTDEGGGFDISATRMALKCSGSGDDTAFTARKQAMENFLFQPRAMG